MRFLEDDLPLITIHHNTGVTLEFDNDESIAGIVISIGKETFHLRPQTVTTVPEKLQTVYTTKEKRLEKRQLVFLKFLFEINIPLEYKPGPSSSHGMFNSISPSSFECECETELCSTDTVRLTKSYEDRLENETISENSSFHRYPRTSRIQSDLSDNVPITVFRDQSDLPDNMPSVQNPPRSRKHTVDISISNPCLMYHSRRPSADPGKSFSSSDLQPRSAKNSIAPHPLETDSETEEDFADFTVVVTFNPEQDMYYADKIKIKSRSFFLEIMGKRAVFRNPERSIAPIDSRHGSPSPISWTILKS